VAQVLAKLHVQLHADQQDHLKTRCKEALTGTVTRQGLSRVADLALQLCPMDGHKEGDNSGSMLAAQLISALEDLLAKSDSSAGPIHPAAAVYSHLRREGAQPHCFVAICERLAGDAAGVSREEEGEGRGEGLWGEEGLGVAVGRLEGVMSGMLADDGADVQVCVCMCV
jgi:hypothetical protein